MRRYFFFDGYIDTGRLPIVLVKVSSALLKHLAKNMGWKRFISVYNLQVTLHYLGKSGQGPRVEAGTNIEAMEEHCTVN